MITGASSGIGESIVKTFSQNGWQVIMIARNKEKLQKISQQYENCDALVCDLTDPQAISNLNDYFFQTSINALVNNAGAFKAQSMDSDEDYTWNFHFQTNLMSAVRLTRLLWPNLKRSKGSILNISSTLGVRPITNTAAYSALKAAMNNWTQSLALEGAEYGIRANTICPGIVDTPIHSYFGSNKPEDIEYYQNIQNAQPLGRTGKPTDIANMSFHFCSDESQWITGALLNIDGGILLNS